MTPTQLAALAKVAEAAKKEAPLPWAVQYDGDGERVLGVADSLSREVVETDCGVYPPCGPVADFIVSAVNNHDALIARAQRADELERLGAEWLDADNACRRLDYDESISVNELNSRLVAATNALRAALKEQL